MRYLKNIFVLIGMVVFMASCEKDEIKAVINTGATPALSLSAQQLTLDKEAADANALTITWAKPEYGQNLSVQYRLLLAKAGTNFAEAQAFTGTGLSKSWTHKQLNALLQSMGYKGNENADIEVMVESIVSADVVQKSPILAFNAVTYLDRLDLSSPWGLVGSATPNGWNGPDVPFYKTAKSGVFVCYATLVDGEMKIRENNDWAVNYGDNGADGTLERDGANLVVTAGTYAITYDANASTVKVEKYSWGIVGSAAPNGWDGPDVNFFYDPATDQWRAFVNLLDGEMKIRKNNDWGLNYGDNGVDGTLDKDGSNIAVTAGLYLVTLNLNELTYTIERTSIPGIVGSGAPNGWDGPDVAMTRDFGRDNVWVANNVALKDGEIKFRMNNDWGTNYGGSGGSLTKNGANIAISAGNYDIELDLTNTETPSYKITKK